jgi:exonuclease III
MTGNRAIGDEDPTEKATTIRLVSYNIRNGRAGRLEAALRAMAQANVDLGVFQETKLTDGIYTRQSSGYQVIASNAPSKHQGGIALFWRDSPHWQVEAYKAYGPNVLSFQLVTGLRRWYVVGAYVPPSDTSTIEYVSKALDDRPEGVDPILIGDLNANLADPDSDREHEIAAAAADHGLEDMFSHFRQSRAYKAGYTWKQWRLGRMETSRCDYLLGTDRRTFTNVCLKEPRFDSDHYMVLGKIRSAKLNENRAYMRGRKSFPLRIPSARPLKKAECLFEDLRLSAEKQETETRRVASWISAETWGLVDTRTALRRDVLHDRAAIRCLNRAVKASLKADRKRRVEVAGDKVESFLKADPPDLQAAWNAMKGWYRDAGDRAPPPARSTLKKVTTERADLYRKEEPPGDPIPILVEPVEVRDDVPDEGEIADAVKRLRNNRSGGPSGIRGEHLKAWMNAAIGGGDDTPWRKLVELVQHGFKTGDLPEAMAWSVMILLPKGDGDYRGIGLVEVIWKLIAAIINERLKESIDFHDALHGFRAGRGTGTATIEAKLCQQLAAIKQVPLYQIYLDLRKAYDALDRERCIDILEGYGVGRRIVGLLTNYWKKQRIVAKGEWISWGPFRGNQGCHSGGRTRCPRPFSISWSTQSLGSGCRRCAAMQL